MSKIVERLVDRLAVAQASSAAITSRSLWARFRRAALMPLVNSGGRAFGFVMRASGSPVIFWVHALILAKINPAHLARFSEASSPRERELLNFLRQFREASGKECSFLILFTHPEPGKKMQLFSVALYHHIFRIGSLLYYGGFAKSYPRMILAIDPFALDSMGWLSSSFYAGFAHTFHFTLDRQPSRLSWLQKSVVLKRSASAEAGFKFVNQMKPGSVLALAQAGGEPQNARLLFTTREFVSAVCKAHIEFDRASFLANLTRHPIMPADRLHQIENCSEKLSDHDLILDVFNSILTQEALVSGKLDDTHKKQMSEVLHWAGVGENLIPGLIERFETEFQRYTPYRERLFNILIGRILKPDLPIALIPIWHDWHEESVHLENQEILWLHPSGERTRYLLKDGKLKKEAVAGIAQFSKEFTTTHFPR